MEHNAGGRAYTVCAAYANDATTSIASWDLPRLGSGTVVEINDELWSASFGMHQRELEQIQQPCRLKIDFSSVTWIDPLPLLGLMTEAKNFCARTGSSLIIELGRPYQNGGDGARFLNFVVQHGFLEALIPLSEGIVKLNGKSYRLNHAGPLADLKIDARLNFAPSDSRCLSAKILRLQDLGPSGDTRIDVSVSNVVQKWLDEMIKCGLSSYFKGEPESIENFCHRIGILLTELALNAFKHAYGEKPRTEACHFGIYARLRGYPPSKIAYETVRKREIGSHTTLHQLQIDEHDAAFDLYYFDAGIGITADFEKWKQNADERLLRYFKGIKPTTNVLHKVCTLLFKEAISRLSRQDNTPQTGFQHIGMILSDTEDYARVYTDGQWTGAMLPWTKMTTSSLRNLKKDKSIALSKIAPCRGTGWQYCIRLESKLRREDDPRREDWQSISAKAVDSHARGDVFREQFHCYDERITGDYIDWWRAPLISNQCFWLPRAVTKQHVLQWYSRIVQDHDSDEASTVIWTIADISFVQALTIASVVEAQKIRCPRRSNIEIRVVTSDWLIKCFVMKRTGDDNSFEYDHELTERVARNEAANIYNALKARDSAVFWQGIVDEDDAARKRRTSAKKAASTPLIKEKIIWSRDRGGKVVVTLDGYLDLSQALVDPVRFLVAMRALRRTWHLHSADAECIDADGLMVNLLPREARLSLKARLQKKNVGAAMLFVGSVYVTGSTTDKFERAGNECIYLVRHPNFVDKRSDLNLATTPPSPSRFALNWTEESYTVLPPPKNKLEYERIPETPYIGRGGMKAIPIRRFDRPDKKTGQEAFSKTLYGQAPIETYEHLIGLKVMKLGHWSDGKHHDLITLNLNRAIELESRDKGPIIQWLIEKFVNLKKKGVDIVVYPSHQVNERIVRILKKHTEGVGAADSIPKHFIPVHFLGQHAQTSIRIPSLTYDRIRDILESEKKTNRSVVLLDDGVLTGKVQRELEQLIFNATAKQVIHLCLVNRTGLPLYRQLIINQNRESTHHYYWRWDVPTLGNARTCPLCRAIEQVSDMSKIALNDEISKELTSWKQKWQHRPVDSDWFSHGMEPSRLPKNRKITFGKEWSVEKGQAKYPIEHSTSTGLSATVIEIMRTTSYMEVGDKIARSPWPEDEEAEEFESKQWRRVKIEILASQILLFFDDLDNDKIVRRFNLLLSDLIESHDEDSEREIEMLACLVLLLATEEQAKAVAGTAIVVLSKVKGSLSLPAMIVVATLLKRARFDFFSPRDLLISNGLNPRVTDTQVKVAVSHIVTAYATVFGLAADKTRSALFFLIMAIGADMESAHHGFFRQRLINSGEMTVDEIRFYLNQIKKSLEEIDGLIVTGAVGASFDIRRYIDTTISCISFVDNAYLQGPTDYTQFVRGIKKHLFGEDSLARNFHKDFIYSIERLKDFMEHDITDQDWFRLIEEKKSKINLSRWKRDGDGIYRCPDIDAYVSDDCDRSALVVFPPIARQMVREFLFNTIYSTEPFDSQGEKVDTICNISSTMGLVSIDIRNRFNDYIQPQRPKHAETIVAQHIYRDPATRVKYEIETGEAVVVVRLPMIEHLAKE